MSDRLIEFEGSASLPGAISALYGAGEPDLVIIHDYITDPEMLHAIGEAQGGESANLSALLPNIEAAHETVKDIWVRRGVKNYPVLSKPYVDLTRFGGILPHLDEQIISSNLAVVAQLSVCLHGTRKILAERIPAAVSRDQANNFDEQAYAGLVRAYGDAVFKGDRYPRTSAVISAGGLALFGQFPAVTFHGVEQPKLPKTTKVSRLIDWYAKKQ